MAPDDTPPGRRNAPERSALTPTGLRVLYVSGRDATTPAGSDAITIAITLTAVCITPIPVCNAPLTIGDTPLGTRITHAGLCDTPLATGVMQSEMGVMLAAV